jgi:hypothetical protein
MKEQLIRIAEVLCSASGTYEMGYDGATEEFEQIMDKLLEVGLISSSEVKEVKEVLYWS